MPALLVVIASMTWLAAVFAAPLVSSQTSAGATASAAVYLAGSLVCHQQPDRSFHYGGSQLPVCARCVGLYIGGFAGAVGWALLSRSSRVPRQWIDRLTSISLVRATLAVAAVPTLLSVALGATGMWDGSNGIRALLALPLGAAIGATVTAVAAADLR
jgi:uncharacterized membrane protein